MEDHGGPQWNRYGAAALDAPPHQSSKTLLKWRAQSGAKKKCEEGGAAQRNSYRLTPIAILLPTVLFMELQVEEVEEKGFGGKGVKFTIETGKEEALSKCLHLFSHHTPLLLIGNELNQFFPSRVCSTPDSNW